MSRISLTGLVGKKLTMAVLITVMAASQVSGAAQLTESDVLAELAEKAIQPSLAEVATASRGLAEAVGLLCEQKDAASLKKARDGWRTAYLAWRTAQPLMLDGKQYKVEQLVENWPVNDVVLKAASDSKDLAHLLNAPDMRGFSGAEYLLFGITDVTEITVAGRCEHLQTVVAEIADQASSNQRIWQQEAQAFVAAGDGNPYLISGDALALVFVRLFNVTERMLRDRLMVPSGFFEGTSKPELLESWRSDTTRLSFRATMAGLRRAMIGENDNGITALVAIKDGLLSKKNPALAADIKDQFDTIDRHLDGLDDGILMHKQLQKDDQLLDDLYQSIEQLQELIVETSLNLEVDVRGPSETIVQ